MTSFHGMEITILVHLRLTGICSYSYFFVLLLNVSRSLSGVRGWTRETLAALTTTIESREWMRRERAYNGLPPEHPRATSTDDVECFFSIMRNTIGADFTTKKLLEWRKVCQEFSKRINPDLSFYYYTATHDRFYEGDRDSFDIFKPSKSNPRKQRVNTQEQPGSWQ